jgi:hypothetical protein
MIRGEVIRQSPRPDGTGTPGSLRLENGFQCDTLELVWHANERGRSCTAAGVDRGKVMYSPHLKRLVVHYEDRNGRQDCEIHNGNFAGDEALDEVTNVHGCTVVGHGYGDVVRSDGKRQWGVKVSGATLAGLIESLMSPDGETEIDGQRYHDVEITYRWADGCSPE